MRTFALLAFALVFVGCGSSSSGDQTAAPPPAATGGSTGAGGSTGTTGGAAGMGVTGSKCTQASDCYPTLDGGMVQGGNVMCLDKVPGGYCTHLCTQDSDCCAVSGECPDSRVKEVCAPFENTGMMMCFVSCESPDVFAVPDATADGGTTTDPTAFCQSFNAVFTCRSTGGGAKNRQFCGE